MSKKKKNWGTVGWTEFRRVADLSNYPAWCRPDEVFVNSIYQVSVFYDDPISPFGKVTHLSFKTHDRQARHDWREMQRIKNEIVGEEVDSVEIYPAESKLMDTSNQYHLFCFPYYSLPIGIKERFVMEESSDGAKQRPFRPEFRPEDLATPEEARKSKNALSSGEKIVGYCPYPKCRGGLVLDEDVIARHEGGKEAPVTRLHCLNGHTLFIGKTEDIERAESDGHKEGSGENTKRGGEGDVGPA